MSAFNFRKGRLNWMFKFQRGVDILITWWRTRLLSQILWSYSHPIIATVSSYDLRYRSDMIRHNFGTELHLIWVLWWWYYIQYIVHCKETATRRWIDQSNPLNFHRIGATPLFQNARATLKHTTQQRCPRQHTHTHTGRLEDHWNQGLYIAGGSVTDPETRAPLHRYGSC